LDQTSGLLDGARDEATRNLPALENTRGDLTQLRAEGYSVRDEDVARLSPLVFEHINLLGRYAFSVPEAVTRASKRQSCLVLSANVRSRSVE
jgi:hypothetical protein